MLVKRQRFVDTLRSTLGYLRVACGACIPAAVNRARQGKEWAYSWQPQHPPHVSPRTFCLGVLCLASAGAHAQQIGLFPQGPYATHCRARGAKLVHGGDDDHNNVWFIEIDPTRIGSTVFYIHVWDGDNNAGNNASALQDVDFYNYAGNSVFEYRLYGGPGAALNDDPINGGNPSSYAGVLIDIDSDANDDTLRTDDPDDIDNNAPEDLRDQAISTICVDMVANPGDLRNGKRIYKFVVDGNFGVANDTNGEFNRYRILATGDAGRTSITGVKMYAYEVTYSGRTSQASARTNFCFTVPATVNNQLDLQTLDLDEHEMNRNPSSRLITSGALGTILDANTFESGQQWVNRWMWSSVNQPESTTAAYNGVTGRTYSTANTVGDVWVFDVNPDSVASNTPFAIRLVGIESGTQSVALPAYLESVFSNYGDGPLGLYGAGLPRAGGGDFSLFVEFADANAPGVFLLGLAPTEQRLSFGSWNLVLYVAPGPSTVGFNCDANGSSQKDLVIPAGVATGPVYAQALALTAARTAVEHSVGLEIRIR